MIKRLKLLGLNRERTDRVSWEGKDRERSKLREAKTEQRED